MSPLVTEVRFMPADTDLRRDGMLGWVSCVIDGRFKAEGIGVRRTRNGRYALAFAFRDDGYGKRWTYLKPINDETRRAVEEQVLRQLRRDWGIAG